MCEFDSGVFATIAAAVITCATALAIAQQWRDQKGAEVVANEIKNIIKDLLEIINTAYHMNSIGTSPEITAEKYARFRILSEQMLRSGLFIYECIEIDNFESTLNEFNELCWAVKDLGLEFDPVKNHNEFKSKLVKKAGYIGSSGMKLVNVLIPYSTYQKKFIFKKKY